MTSPRPATKSSVARAFAQRLVARPTPSSAFPGRHYKKPRLRRLCPHTEFSLPQVSVPQEQKEDKKCQLKEGSEWNAEMTRLGEKSSPAARVEQQIQQDASDSAASRRRSPTIYLISDVILGHTEFLLKSKSGQVQERASTESAKPAERGAWLSSASRV